MITRFTRPGSDVEVLNSQAVWLADQLRDFHRHDLAAVSVADTILAKQSKSLDVTALTFAECRAILRVLTSERLARQPHPQEAWRLDRLRTLVALELDLRDSETG